MCARSSIEHIFYFDNNYGRLFNATTSIPPAANLPYLTDSSLEFVSYDQAHHSPQMTETLVKAVGLSKAKPNLQILAEVFGRSTLSKRKALFSTV
jgi:hypothetical protein